MNDQRLTELLNRYDLDRPEPVFLRHNENRTYRVTDASGTNYLLRIHDPFVEGMKGMQHTRAGITSELHMLEQWGKWNDGAAQAPVRNRQGELVTAFEIDGRSCDVSLLSWMDGRDLVKEDMDNDETVRKLGEQLAELHAFFRQYEPVGMESRPHQGRAYNDMMAGVIRSGVEKGLFTPRDADIVEQTLRLINERLTGRGSDNGTDLIHGDIWLNNAILTTGGEVRFIDFGFYGQGYALTDVAMGTMMLPSEKREDFLNAYHGEVPCSEAELLEIEGFMLVAIIGYYVFQFENEKMHDWMRERMPKLCEEHCVPFLNGERLLGRIGF